MKRNKLTEQQKSLLLSLYNEGKMDSEIATELGNVTSGAVLYWRKKLGLPSKFSYSKISKIEAQKCKALFEQGLSDYKIANILGVSPEGVYSHRQRYKLLRNNSLAENVRIQLTVEQKEFLIGTLLGDSCLQVGKWCKNPRLICMHCAAQKEYAEYKTNIFKSLGAKCVYRKRHTPDKRNGKHYESYTMETPANPDYLSFYRAFYTNGKKHIPFELLEFFTPRSLALWFMDDGYKVRKTGYAICTNCFGKDELVKMQLFLKDAFDLDVTIWSNNCLYIKKNCTEKFKALILPYMCNCMLYKLL